MQFFFFKLIFPFITIISIDLQSWIDVIMFFQNLYLQGYESSIHICGLFKSKPKVIESTWNSFTSKFFFLVHLNIDVLDI